MALGIGSNFSYQGHKFLDDRQKVDSIGKLLEWSTLVPEGFEVYVEDYGWFQYDSSYMSEMTGHFCKRVDIDLPGSNLEQTIETNTQNIQDLLREVFTLKIDSVTSRVPGWTFEKGSSVTPSFTWLVKRKGTSVVPLDSFINGVSIGPVTEYIAPSPITSSTSYQIKSTYEGLEASTSATYSFYYKKYWGVSEKESLEGQEIINLPGNTWATSGALGNTSFNCTGGKYPYYVIPVEQYTSGFTVWVGGLVTSDLVVTDINLTNASGAIHPYKVVRLGNIQTGILNIKVTV